MHPALCEKLDQVTQGDGSIDVGRLLLLIDKAYEDQELGGSLRLSSGDQATRQQTEERLKASERRFRDLVEASSDWFWETDADHRYTYISPRVEARLGISPASLIGRVRTQYWQDGPGWKDHLALLEQRLPFRDFVFTVTLPGLPPQVIRSSGSPIFGESDGGDGGVFLGYRGTASNITAEVEAEKRTQTLSREIDTRARTERALRDSQERLLAITASLFEGVMLVDPYGHVVFANKSAQRWLGVAQMMGRELDDMMCLARRGDLLPFADSTFRQVIETGETVIDDDATFVTSDGRHLSVAYAASPLEEDGKRRAAIVSFRSIEALKEAQREALQSSRLASVGQLAAGIAHEINTPIQYVGDNLRFLKDSFGTIAGAFADIQALFAGDGERAAALEALLATREIDYLLEEMPMATTQSLDGVEHVAHIVRSMKEFSHPGSTAKVATDINRAIESTVTVSRNEWKQVATVETHLSPELPTVVCFPAEINQVLLNLIVNAAQAIEASASRDGPGLIRISTHRDGDFVEIRVADSGPGVPAAIRDQIFDPFFTTKPVGKGTGQGLAISQDVIVNKHGGRITLDESAATGAVFVIRLPVGDTGGG